MDLQSSNWIFERLRSLPVVLWLFAFSVAQAATITINTAVPSGTSQLRLGVTHTQVGWENGNATAVVRARGLLQAAMRIQNQSIMGWGANRLQASQGAPYTFSSLDARVILMQSLGTNLALTLCTAPGWMKTSGQDWNMEDRVADNRVTDFAALCQAVAQRYTNVHYFQVWNEMKGYWNSSIRNSDGSWGNWDCARYTALYNEVYRAIKSVRPDAEVGGCYVPLVGDASNTRGYSGPGTETPLVTRDLDCINYWLANRAGADFICFDRWLAGWSNPSRLTEADQLALTWTYQKVLQIFRARTSLPIWISEYYTANYNTAADQFEACANASMYYWMIRGASNASVTALLWNPAEGEAGVAHYLFTGTSTSSGGQTTPHYAVFKAFSDYFGPGTQLYQAVCSDTNIEVLASPVKTVLINKYNSSHTVTVNGMNLVLPAYAVQLIDTPLSGPAPRVIMTLPPGSQTNGQFAFQFPGQTNRSCVVEASTNLILWLPLKTNAPISGAVTFTDTNATAPQCFYRIRL